MTPTINRDLRLSPHQYQQTRHKKDLIVLHHTVGGTAKSTFEYWRSTPERVATAYLIERDGTVFEVFPPECWAPHVGVKGNQNALDKRSIGIEIASEGALKESGGKLYCFDRVTPRTEHTTANFDNGVKWRGYRYFDAYEEAQLMAVFSLVNLLLLKFQIPRRMPANFKDFEARFLTFAGVLGHCNLRADKSDPHPGFDWERLQQECALELA